MSGAGRLANRSGVRRLAGLPANRALGLVAALLLGVLMAGCTAGAQDLPAAREGRSGLQGTGTIDGRHVAVGQGLPELLVGDCDPIDGRDNDVCFISGTIDGRSFVLNFENPEVLVEGETLDVADPPCGAPADCDQVRDVAIVSVKLETDEPIRATGGTVTVDRVVPFANYRGAVRLELPDGRFNGTFDVVPRPE